MSSKKKLHVVKMCRLKKFKSLHILLNFGQDNGNRTQLFIKTDKYITTKRFKKIQKKPIIKDEGIGQRSIKR